MNFVLLVAAKATLVVLLAWVTTLSMRRAPAATRHLIWLAAITALLLLPLLSLALPEVPLRVLPKTEALEAVTGSGRSGGSGGNGDSGTAPAVAPGVAGEGALETPLRAAPPIPRRNLSGVTVLLAAYLAGILTLLLNLGVALLQIHRWTARSRPFAERHLPVLPGLPATDVRISEAIAAPVTWGVFRPVILLPREAVTWSPQRLRSALVHELAHIARRDWLTQLLARQVAIFHWWNPLVWMASRRLSLEAERACDERVLAAGSGPGDYAEFLLELSLRVRRRARIDAVVGLARGSDLRSRVVAILAGARTGAMSLRSSAAIALAILLVSLLPAPLHLARASSAAPQRGGVEIPRLLLAAAEGDVRQVRRLLDQGADVDRTLPALGSPLILAASEGHTEVVELLLERGADPNVAEESSPRDLQRTALGAAAKEGHLRIAVALLDAGAEVDRAPEGDATPLMEAAAHAHRGLVAELLARGADPDVRIDGDGTPLIEAARGGDLEIVKRLLAGGADPDGAVEGDGSPLIAAVRKGNRELVKLLLAAGADPELYVPGDESPLLQAVARGRSDLARLLLNADAAR